jgi:hypothetical protein
VAEQKKQFGGFKFGAAFFGWLTAVGSIVILSILIAALGAAIGFDVFSSTTEAAEAVTDNATAIAITGAIVVLVIVFVGYFAGGYVAGRMARFDGFKQGVAVWLWGVAIAIVLAIVGLIAGDQISLPTEASGVPTIPLRAEEMTTASIISAVATLIVAFIGAVLGGLAGMRFHRKVDRAGLDH